MIRSILISSILVLSLACSQEKEEKEISVRDRDLMRIDSVETLIRASIDSSKNPEIQLSLQAIKQYEIFAYKYPQDSLTPAYIFKSAQITDAILGDKQKAAKLYQNIYDMYPDYPNRPMMLFYQANALHDLGDTSAAINQLKLFIARYPNHEFSDDAENLINFIRMDEQDMEKFFK